MLCQSRVLHRETWSSVVDSYCIISQPFQGGIIRPGVWRQAAVRFNPRGKIRIECRDTTLAAAPTCGPLARRRHAPDVNRLSCELVSLSRRSFSLRCLACLSTKSPGRIHSSSQPISALEHPNRRSHMSPLAFVLRQALPRGAIVGLPVIA